MPQTDAAATFRRAAALAVFACGGASVPADVHVSATPRTLTFDHDGTVFATAVICPGFAFDTFGTAGPKFSPDNHWLLVDVIGPYEPGDVPRTRALVEVPTGRVVLAPNFPEYLGVPTTLQPIAWASGQRATLAYPNGKSATLHEPPLRAIPPERCAATPAAPGAATTAPAPGASATPYPF